MHQTFRKQITANKRKSAFLMIGFCLFGLFIWMLGGVVFWFGVLSPRFRSITLRQDFRAPEAGAYRSRPPRPRRAAPQAAPPLPKNVILVDETWDESPDEDDDPEDWRQRLRPGS